MMDRKTLNAVALCVAFLLLYRPILHRFGLDRYLSPAAPPAPPTAVDTTRRDTSAAASRGTATLGQAAGRGAPVTTATGQAPAPGAPSRSEEHTSELQSRGLISYAV